MRLVALILSISVTVGLLTGGRLRGLGGLSIRWTPLALAGLVLQVLPPEDLWPVGLMFTSFVLLLVFCAANLRAPGFALILAGTAMNFLVIGINQGMPVDRAALVESGQRDTLDDLIRDGGAKHHLASPDDRLMFLADVIALPPPIRQAVSAGDIVAYVGVGYLVVAGMRRERRDVVPVRATAAPVGDG